MAITRTKKEEVIKRVSDIVKNAKSLVFVNFHGLSVGDISKIRRELKKHGVSYLVAKKTLVKRVLDGAKIGGVPPNLTGELAMAYGDDVVLPSKGIFEFKKKFKENLIPLGGIMEMKYLTSDEVKTLAAVPGREVLYGQFVTVIYSPVQGVVSVLNNIMSSFVVTLDQIVQSKTS